MEYNDVNKENRVRTRFIIASLIIFEAIFVLVICLFFAEQAFAGIGQNVTVITRLQVGNVYPEIINVSVDNGVTGVDLVANATKLVTIFAIVRDFNGDTDLNSSDSRFFDNIGSSYGAGNDNNSHYSNYSCEINTSYGDAYEASVTCLYNVWYYANNITWNGTIMVNDTYDYTALGSDTILVNNLLSIGLPEQIDYGTVNATNVSDEQIVNVTNYGNIRVNLSVEGYGYNRSDGLAMNCTLGLTRNISVYYEKYNMTTSNNTLLSLPQFESHYANLTSSAVVKTFNLYYQQDEGVNEAVNATYWRIYVPRGVAGSCVGNIIFGATRSSGN